SVFTSQRALSHKLRGEPAGRQYSEDSRAAQTQLPRRNDPLRQTALDIARRVRDMKKNNDLGPIIKRQREGFRLTQRELARKLGVKASHVAYIEGGLRRPSLSLVRRLAETLGLNKQKLLLITYPEVRFLITLPPKPSAESRDAAFRQFAGDRAMLSEHSITPA